MFLKRDNPYVLVVGMAGVKMGDRMVQIGCGHGGRLGALAANVGLSGHAVAVVPDAASAARARKGAADAGVLVDVQVAPPTKLPLEDGSFDLVVVDDTDGRPGIARVRTIRRAAVGELLRVLRPGGRVFLIGAAPRSGLARPDVAGAERPALGGVGRGREGARGRRIQARANARGTGRPGVRRGNQAAPELVAGGWWLVATALSPGPDTRGP